MKRATALVEYPSSSEDGGDASDAEKAVQPPPPPKKLKRLPSLPAYLTPQAPADNPALHQGRRRTTPHVEGQFAAFVYVPLMVEKSSKLYRLLRRMFSRAREIVPTLHSIGFSGSEEGEKPHEDNDASRGAIELHISLTRPTYLRAHQRADFKRAVQRAARSTSKFPASFATLSELTNDEKTRTFLTLEVGAGHDNFKALSDELTPILKSIRQKEFYQDPRFHASIAWALLDGAHMPTSQGQPQQAGSSTTSESLLDGDPSRSPSGNTLTADQAQAHSAGDPLFPTIPHFPPDFVQQLRGEFGRELVSAGTFEAEEVHVRIGKDIGKWRMRD